MSDHDRPDHDRPDHDRPDHDPSRPARQSARMMACLGAGAVLASVALVSGIAMQSDGSEMLPAAQAAPGTSTTTASSGSATTSTPTTSTPTTSGATTTGTTTSSKSAGAYAKDARGYVDSEARCAESQTLMALGRTERSLVAICVDPDGSLEYRGVRLSDESSLKVPASRGSNDSVIADNDGVTYSVSPTVFLVSEGDSVIYRDSWIEFQQPGFGNETSGTSTSTVSTTVSTTTVTVTTTATATATKPAG